MGLYSDAMVEALRRGAASVAADWGASPQATVALLNISENATFRVDDPAGPTRVLRVYRPGYHSLAEIESELRWIEALRADEVVDTPAPLRTRAGERLARFDHRGETRHVAAFAFMTGVEPRPDAALVAGFEALGAISARLHAQSRRWTRPAGFTRKRWTFETTLGAAPHWGDWRAAMGLTSAGRATIERLCAVLEARLAAFGDGPDRFGLVHADLRLANLLQDGDRLGVIDFDDCGFSWFAYDFAAAISFIEEDPLIPALQDAWVAGYRRVAPLAQADVAEFDSFILLRRTLLTAWLASHAETPTAQALGAAYTEGTLRLADAYLIQRG